MLMKKYNNELIEVKSFQELPSVWEFHRFGEKASFSQLEGIMAPIMFSASIGESIKYIQYHF